MKGKETPMMGRNERMGHQLCKRMRNMSAKQDHDLLKKDTTVSDHHGTRNTPLQAGCDGPNHWPPQA
jgi:hypothetical protein